MKKNIAEDTLMNVAPKYLEKAENESVNLSLGELLDCDTLPYRLPPNIMAIIIEAWHNEYYGLTKNNNYPQ